MDLIIEQQNHYNTDVWTHVGMDELRREHCMCRHCTKMKPESEDHCLIAASLYEICVDTNIALLVTRCPEFENAGKQIWPEEGVL